MMTLFLTFLSLCLLRLVLRDVDIKGEVIKVFYTYFSSCFMMNTSFVTVLKDVFVGYAESFDKLSAQNCYVDSN